MVGSLSLETINTFLVGFMRIRIEGSAVVDSNKFHNIGFFQSQERRQLS